jgi:hypothetical protein
MGTSIKLEGAECFERKLKEFHNRIEQSVLGWGEEAGEIMVKDMKGLLDRHIDNNVLVRSIGVETKGRGFKAKVDVGPREGFERTVRPEVTPFARKFGIRRFNPVVKNPLQEFQILEYGAAPHVIPDSLKIKGLHVKHPGVAPNPIMRDTFFRQLGKIGKVYQDGLLKVCKKVFAGKTGN